MHAFLHFVLIVLGLTFGGTLGGGSGALIGGLAGFFVARLIKRSADLSPLIAEVEQLRREVAGLTRELNRLAERLDGLARQPAGAARTDATPEDARDRDARVPPPGPATPGEAFQAGAADRFPGDGDAPVEAAPEPAVAMAGAGTPALRTAAAIPQGPGASEAPPDEPPSAEAAPHGAPARPRFDPLAAARNWLLGGNALVRVGVVVLFFGIGFLVKFAAEHARLPVELRYAGIALAAIVALAVGWRLRTRRPEYGMALQGLGIATLYLVIFAAFRLHDLLPGGLTLALLVAVCALSAAIAILQNARSMAVIGISGGFLAPVLASTGGGSHVALFSYYALLNAGVFGIAWFRAWRPLNVLGFLFTFGIGSLWGSRNYTDALFATTEPFLALFFLLYLAVSVLYAGRRQAEAGRYAIHLGGERIDYVDGTLVFGTPLAAFGLQYLMVKDMPLGSAYSALALGLVYLPLASVIHRRRPEFRLLVESFLALGVIFASLAIPLGLDAKWTSAAWAAEGAGIFWVGLRQNRPAARAFALMLEIGSAVSLLTSLRSASEPNFLGMVPVFDGSFLGPLCVGAAALSSAELIRRHGARATAVEAGLEPLARIVGLVFANLAFPMFLDHARSGLALVLSGALTAWIAIGRGNPPAILTGMLFQFFGGVTFLQFVSSRSETPLLNLPWLGGMLVAAGGMASGLRLSRDGALARFAPVGLAWGLCWWWGTHHEEIARHVLRQFQTAADVGLVAVTALLLLLGGARFRWPAATAASALLLPGLLFWALATWKTTAHPGADIGWLAWPVAAGAMMLVLRRLEGLAPTRWIQVGHGFALLLVTALLTREAWWWFDQLGDARSAWPLFGRALAPLAVVGLLCLPAARRRWPLAAFAEAYRWASTAVAVTLWAWIFLVTAVSDGNAAPLPYLPLANPIDLATAGGLLALFAWFRLWHDRPDRTFPIDAVVAGTTFYWLNAVLLRTLHHWVGIPFRLEQMLQSTLVQACLSLFWTTLALGAMLFATRRSLRPLWLVGGALLAVVVVKLFLVDLSRVGTVERIVSFIGVGLLLLVIGYFAPVPPKRPP